MFNIKFEQYITSNKENKITISQKKKKIQVLWTTIKAAQEIGLLYFNKKDKTKTNYMKDKLIYKTNLNKYK